MANIIKSEQYNNPHAVKNTLDRYDAVLIAKNDQKGRLIYQSRNTGLVIVVSKLGVLWKLDYYKTCGVCDK
jgi:hypothetical protein